MRFRHADVAGPGTWLNCQPPCRSLKVGQEVCQSELTTFPYRQSLSGYRGVRALALPEFWQLERLFVLPQEAVFGNWAASSLPNEDRPCSWSGKNVSNACLVLATGVANSSPTPDAAPPVTTSPQVDTHTRLPLRWRSGGRSHDDT
jgi:hypothetical protein